MLFSFASIEPSARSNQRGTLLCGDHARIVVENIVVSSPANSGKTRRKHCAESIDFSTTKTTFF